jgi:hypothetical protein
MNTNRHCTAKPYNETCTGLWAKLWANSSGLVGIFSQCVGPNDFSVSA